MLNIVIPLAGRGSRFVEAGYEIPKPLIPIDGEPMIKHVIDNLKPKCNHRFIFICQQEHIQKYNLRKEDIRKKDTQNEKKDSELSTGITIQPES